MKFPVKNNCEKVLKKRGVVLFIFSCILLLFALRHSIYAVLNRLLVDPIMSKLNDYAFFCFSALFLVLGFYYFASSKVERYKSNKRLWVIIVVFVLYCYSLLYSCEDGLGWDFASIIPSGCFFTYYSTLIFLVPLIGEFCLYCQRRKKTKEQNQNNDLSFIYETPVKEEHGDSYNRKGYCRIVAEKVRNNYHEEGAFVIGIWGDWGAGKTSFVNLVKSKLEDKDADIKFDFNPWTSSSHSNVVTDFFSLLSKQLSDSIPDFQNKLTEYAEYLSDMNVDPILKYGLNIFKSRSFKSSNVRYEEISSILQKSKLRILVFIDDLDRLSKSEVLEVFRLVRNTANFPYLQFLITYDRDYVLNIMDVPNPDVYLRKIFNLEVSLPIYDVKVIRESLKQHIGELKLLNAEQKEVVSDFLSPYNDANGFPVEFIIKTERDVIRFVNSLIVSTEAISRSLGSNGLDEINILDLIRVELIKYRDPAYYDRLAQSPLSELKVVDNERYVYNQISDNQSMLKSNATDQPSQDVGDIEFFKDESKISNSKNIRHEDVIHVCMASLFPERAVDDIRSISMIRSFNQYFSYRYDERNISESEVHNILLSSDTQLDTVEGYCSSKNEMEVYHMLTSIISKHKSDEWLTDSKSPYFYKTVLTLLFSLMESKDNEIVKYVMNSSKVLFTLPTYKNLDYYLEVLKLWDRFLAFDSVVPLDNINIMLGFMNNGNLRVKLSREVITDDDRKKIENFIRSTSNPVQMSHLLNPFSYSNRKDIYDDCILEASVVKNIQKSFFFKYAEMGKVDEDCLKLFRLSLVTDPKTNGYIWDENASKKMRELVDIDAKGYLSLFIVEIPTSSDEIRFYMARLWELIFNNDPDEVDSYLYNDDKNDVDKIDEIRNFWELFKENRFKAVSRKL